MAQAQSKRRSAVKHEVLRYARKLRPQALLGRRKDVEAGRKCCAHSRGIVAQNGWRGDGCHLFRRSGEGRKRRRSRLYSLCNMIVRRDSETRPIAEARRLRSKGSDVAQTTAIRMH